jgi:pSer/pThr/pTyr-binding forkhead associated (FHA) protein
MVAGVDAYLESPGAGPVPVDRPLSIGRSSGNDLVVNDTEVSRRHAVINLQGDGEAWLVDLGSTNGTYLNDRRVVRPTEMQDGDRLTVGRSVWTFRRNREANQPEMATQVTQLTQPAVRLVQAWLVLADIEGFTRFTQANPPEEVARHVGQWMLTSAGVFQRHGTDIQVYTGDGYFAYVTDKPGEPSRFFSIFRELRALQAAETRLPFRLLVHQDKITLGAASPGGVESIFGPGVILLFRMEKIASRFRARCALTAAAVKSWPEPITPQSLGEHELAGFADKHALFSL